MNKKLLLAYSGGLDTSVICRWLTEKNYEVVCFVANVGQREDFAELEKKARRSGAVDFVVADCRQAFVEDFVTPSICFNALYEGRYLLGTALARPAIAQAMVAYAKERGISLYAHGATGKGNDQVRFEFSIYALHRGAKVVAPWRDLEFCSIFKGRKEAIEYANKHDIPIKATIKQPWSSDENLFHLSFESGMLEDPAAVPQQQMYELTVAPEKAPDQAQEIAIGFSSGRAVALDGKALPPVQLLAKLNALGGQHGIGRIDIVESRFVGMKSRGVYETPGGTILLAAHRDIEGMTLPGGVIALKDKLSSEFATLVYNGMWFSKEVECLLAFLNETQKCVSGEVRLRLYKGNVMVISRRSERSLYDEKMASMEDDEGAYSPSDADGFIRLHSLPLIYSQRQKEQGK